MGNLFKVVLMSPHTVVLEKSEIRNHAQWWTLNSTVGRLGGLDEGPPLQMRTMPSTTSWLAGIVTHFRMSIVEAGLDSGSCSVC
jgi:hypothetical protein